MPVLAILTLLLQFTCGYHAVKTGRVSPWLYIIIFLPVIGSLIYLFAELLPDLQHSRAGQQVASDIAKVANPQKRLRELARNLERADTVENKKVLAEECIEHEMFDEAIDLYERALQPPYEHDPALLLGLARAQYGAGQWTGCVASLDMLQEHNPDFYSTDGHLLYAKALTEAGQLDDAFHEYAYLIDHYPGEEAKCRYAILLEQVGDATKAQELYRDIVHSVDSSPKHYYRRQKSWYDVARRNMTG